MNCEFDWGFVSLPLGVICRSGSTWPYSHALLNMISRCAFLNLHTNMAGLNTVFEQVRVNVSQTHMQRPSESLISEYKA